MQRRVEGTILILGTTKCVMVMFAYGLIESCQWGWRWGNANTLGLPMKCLQLEVLCIEQYMCVSGFPTLPRYFHRT